MKQTPQACSPHCILDKLLIQGGGCLESRAFKDTSISKGKKLLAYSINFIPLRELGLVIVGVSLKSQFHCSQKAFEHVSKVAYKLSSQIEVISKVKLYYYMGTPIPSI